jgi:hypothetical protein
MSNDRMSDQDVERIASAVVRKLLFYLVIGFALMFLLPTVCMYAFRSVPG